MFLSIVIPVYNSAEYLPKCLDSIWSQGLPEDDYEVVCVDDCSTDDSLAVLQQEATSHRQLRVLQNPTNLRAGGARNYGVKEARGKFIQFIDSDDYFHPGSLLKAYYYQKQHLLDILVCDMSRESYGGPISDIFVLNYPCQSILSGRDFLLANGLPGGPTKYLFLRSLMADNDVWFTERVASEDPDWTWKLPFFARTMQYQPILIHHYVLYPDSSVGSEYKSKKAIFDRVCCGKRIMDLCNLYGEKEKQMIFRYAIVIYKVGLLYFCAISSSTKEKISIINNYVIKKQELPGLVGFAANHPIHYALFSTVISPLFICLLFIKRFLKKR